jgi:hypothetical protein
MAETRRNLHQFLKGKQLYSALYGVYMEVLHDLTAVLKDSAAKGETAKTIITEPPSNEDFRERSVTTARNWAMSGLTASNLPVICGVGAVTCTRSARKKAMQHRYRHAATASW